VAQQKKELSAEAMSAADAAKALAAAERRLESAAAEKADLQQRFAELQQQLAPLEGRVQAAIAETKVPYSTLIPDAMHSACRLVHVWSCWPHSCRLHTLLRVLKQNIIKPLAFLQLHGKKKLAVTGGH